LPHEANRVIREWCVYLIVTDRVNKYGYVHTRVNGTDFKIKDSVRGTDSSSAARRLATDDRVKSLRVEYDRSIRVHLETGELFRFGPETNSGMLPDGWSIRSVVGHSAEMGASAHVVIEPQ
jgi:hypothetical protein